MVAKNIGLIFGGIGALVLLIGLVFTISNPSFIWLDRQRTSSFLKGEYVPGPDFFNVKASVAPRSPPRRQAASPPLDLHLFPYLATWLNPVRMVKIARTRG
jgi:hypothetical protein